MSGFGFKPPKEFGERSDQGLGDLRSLHNMSQLRFAKADTPDGVAIKGNGFDTVTRAPPPRFRPPRYVSVGRFGKDTLATLVLANGLRPPFKVLPLAVVGTYDGKTAGELWLGVNRSVRISDVANDGQLIRESRTHDFKTKTLEAQTTFAPAKLGTDTYIVGQHANHYAEIKVNPDGTKTVVITEYETETWSFLSGDNVLPRNSYRGDDGGWYYSFVQGYAGFDHLPRISWQLRPNVHMIGHAVVPRGMVYEFQGRPPASPSTTVPYPLFQISTDCARTYSPVNLDALFVGSTYTYEYPVSQANTSPGGYIRRGGYMAVFDMSIKLLTDMTFIALFIPVDSPSSGSVLSTSGLNVEARIFRCPGLNFTALERTSVPDGFGTLWGGAPRLVFAATSPSVGQVSTDIGGLSKVPGFGAIGVVCGAYGNDQDAPPSLIFVSFDKGDTWSAPRPLPAPAWRCGIVEEISTREISVTVYEPTAPPQVVRYGSLDLGLTWQRMQVVAENAAEIKPTFPGGPMAYLSEFLTVLAVEPDPRGLPDTLLPVGTPMAGWRHDSRVMPFIKRP